MKNRGRKPVAPEKKLRHRVWLCLNDMQFSEWNRDDPKWIRAAIDARIQQRIADDCKYK